MYFNDHSQLYDNAYIGTAVKQFKLSKDSLTHQVTSKISVYRILVSHYSRVQSWICKLQYTVAILQEIHLVQLSFSTNFLTSWRIKI